MIIAVTMLYIVGCSRENDDKEYRQLSPTEGIVVTEGAVKFDKKADKKTKKNTGEFYYSYNSENGQETDMYKEATSKVRTELDAYRDIRSPYEKVQITLMVQQLSPDYRLLCSACHDDYANGVIGPALLGKDAEYIFNRIMAFKNGKKQNPLMKQLVNRIEEKRLKAIAKEIERFNKEIQQMRSQKK